MLIDVFDNDGFTMSSLTALINIQPYQPGRISQLGYFAEQGVSTTTIQIERSNGSLNLVATSPRGGVGQQTKADKRDLTPFNVPHLPQNATIYADEIQNLRAAGSESEEDTMTTYVAQRFATMRRNLDATIEFHRIGAIKGLVLDADGSSVITNLFTQFNLTQQVLSMELDVTTTKVRNLVVAAKRLAEDALGAANVSGYRAFCSDTFFDAFVAHEDVEAAYNRYMEGSFLRDDVRMGFEFAGVTWENYRGTVGGVAFIAAGEAYLVPEGVADLFITRFAPADTMDYANTMGVPYYAQQDRLRMNKGIELEGQSNPANLCTRPDAIIKLTLT